MQEAYDPYAFVRDAYLQRRLYAVFDGNIPARTSTARPGGDDENWAEEALRRTKPTEAAADEDAAPTANRAPTAQLDRWSVSRLSRSEMRATARICAGMPS